MKKVDMTIQSGVTRVLHTAGKYCEGDIVIKAEGGDYDKGYESGVAQGEQNAYDAFWDVYQQNGVRTNYDGAFGGEGWTTEFFKPKYNINPTSAAYMFRKSNISGDLVEICDDLGISMDFSNCTSFMEAFSNAPNITRVGVMDIRKAGANITNMFAFSGVKTIDKVLIAETNTLTYFPGAMLSLENISFEGVIANSISFAYSSNLTMASVDSIISCLKDLTGATAQTITFHATVGGKLTEAQKAAITAKNWTLVY